MAFHWHRSPYGPFATLIAVAATYCHPEALASDDDSYDCLIRLARREGDAEMRVFKAELRAARRDPSLLPDGALAESVQYEDGSDEAFLARLWRDLYGDEPYCAADGARDELDELLERRHAENRQLAAEDARVTAADPDLAEFIRLADQFDGQEHVISRAAYNLHLDAIASSAKARRPGYVPDSWLSQRPGKTTGIATAELAISGYWRRDGAGYTVLDWDLTREAVDQVREAEARRMRQAAGRSLSFACEPACAECGQLASRTELAAPGQVPDEFARWSPSRQATFLLSRDFGKWHLVTTAPDGRQEDRAVTDEDAAAITDACTPPLSYARIHAAGLPGDAGFCPRCDAPYCRRCWHDTGSVLRCPHGHDKPGP
jgi:hypothetical protein